MVTNAYFRLCSTGSLISFCILTLIISPGVPRIPPQPPATDAIARRVVKDIGSPFGDAFCLATYENILLLCNCISAISMICIKCIFVKVKRFKSVHLHRILQILSLNM